jgi:hypothetical protein
MSLRGAPDKDGFGAETLREQELNHEKRERKALTHHIPGRRGTQRKALFNMDGQACANQKIFDYNSLPASLGELSSGAER